MEMQNNLSVKLLEDSTLDAKELETTKIKLSQLNESLNSFLTLHPQTPWPLILDKFNILITRYNQLLQEVSCNYLKGCVIHPDSLPEDDPDSIPRYLLRTKFIPEIEEMESNLIVSIAGDTNQINWIDETKMNNEYEKWKAQINQHDEVAEKFLNWFEIKKKDYDFKRRIPATEQRKRLRPELPRRRKHRASMMKKRLLTTTQTKFEASPLSQSVTLTASNLGSEMEDSKSMLTETVTDLGTDDESANSSVMTESTTNIVEEKDSDEDETNNEEESNVEDESNDDMTLLKTPSKLNGVDDEDSVMASATTNATSNTGTTTSLTLNSSNLGSIYSATPVKKITRNSTLRNELDYEGGGDDENDYEDTYNYDDSDTSSSSSSPSEDEKEKGKEKEKEKGGGSSNNNNNKKTVHKKPAQTIRNIPELNGGKSQEGILEKMIYWLERGGDFD